MSKYILFKDSSGARPKNISKEVYASASYGQSFIYSPEDNPLRIYHFSGSSLQSEDYRILRSLKNTINYYSGQDELFNYDNYLNKPLSLYCFNSAHLGSGIQRGSVSINLYLTGTLLATCNDFREDGILYSTDDTKIGAILYNEGFILINSTASLSNEVYDFTSSYQSYQDNIRWIHAFTNTTASIVFDISHNTKNEVPTSTFFVFADKYKLNHSNNITSISSGSNVVNYWSAYSDNFFQESEEIQIKNTVKSPFLSGSANFEKQTFITRIGLYDENKKLIGYGSLANPVRKTENREYLFKLKIDL